MALIHTCTLAWEWQSTSYLLVTYQQTPLMLSALQFEDSDILTLSPPFFYSTVHFSIIIITDKCNVSMHFVVY